MSNKDIISSWIKDYINRNSRTQLFEGIKDMFYETVPILKKEP